MRECTFVTRNMLGRAWRALAVVLASVALAVAAWPLAAQATPRMDPARTGSLTVRATYGDSALSGVSFKAWRVARFGEDGQLELPDAYAGSGVDLGTPSKASEWDVAARSLLAWAQDKGVVPDATGTTGSSGSVTLADLTPGVYLLAGEAITRGEYVYTPSAYLESVPGLSDDAATYDVESVCKVARTDAPVTPATPSDDNSGSESAGAALTWARRLGLARTGDGSITALGALVLVAVGTVLVVAGLLLWPRRNKR